MGYSRKKEILLYELQYFFEYGRKYSFGEISKEISNIVCPKILEEPKYAIDHLILGMVEYNFFSRSPETNKYELTTKISDIKTPGESTYKEFKRSIPKTDGEVSCPICSNLMHRQRVYTHYQEEHSDYHKLIKLRAKQLYELKILKILYVWATDQLESIFKSGMYIINKNFIRK